MNGEWASLQTVPNPGGFVGAGFDIVGFVDSTGAGLCGRKSLSVDVVLVLVSTSLIESLEERCSNEIGMTGSVRSGSFIGMIAGAAVSRGGGLFDGISCGDGTLVFTMCRIVCCSDDGRYRMIGFGLSLFGGGNFLFSSLYSE